MRVLALTFGGPETASTHYRVAQFAPVLAAAHGIELTLLPAREWKGDPDPRGFDAVLLQKTLLSGGRRARLFSRARRVLYDVDDAIWEPHGRPHGLLTRWRTRARLRATVRGAGRVLAANAHLAAGLRARLPPREQGRIAVLPMALDPSVWTPRAAAQDDAPVFLGWAGAPGNLPYLEALEPVLARLLRDFPRARLRVLCGARPRFRELEFEHEPWSPGAEPAAVRGFDLGLLPLPREDAFAAGKSPIKALQYMASGLPTVADALAGAEEIFATGGALLARGDADWESHLHALLASPAERHALGRAARAAFEARHTLASNAAALACHLRGEGEV